MIPKPTQHIRALHQTLVNDIENDIPDEQRRAMWASVFHHAEQIAHQFQNRDFEAADIVNHWYLDLESPASQTRDARRDDKLCSFRTINQELKDLEVQENRDNYATWERLYRKWWFNGKQGTKPKMPPKVRYAIVTTEDYDTFGSGAWSEVEDDVDALERERENYLGFFQTPNEDPENPMEDNFGCKRLAVRHTAHGVKYMYRGSKGVLNGVYSNTLPEPNYRTSEQRRTLLRTLLRSDNLIDVQLGFSKLRMKPKGKNESKEAYDTRLAKRRFKIRVRHMKNLKLQES
jgi:hypothetical protein